METRAHPARRPSPSSRTCGARAADRGSHAGNQARRPHRGLRQTENRPRHGQSTRRDGRPRCQRRVRVGGAPRTRGASPRRNGRNGGRADPGPGRAYAHGNRPLRCGEGLHPLPPPSRRAARHPPRHLRAGARRARRRIRRRPRLGRRSRRDLARLRPRHLPPLCARSQVPGLRQVFDVRR